jgi:hypothetical protein
MVRSRFRSVLVPAAVLLVALGIAGCLEIPLGDPEQSKVDPKFVGTWMKRDDASGEVTLISAGPYDARTYHVMQYAAKPDPGGAWERGGEMIFKAWLTDVGGQTFVTMQVLGEESDTPYMVVRLELADDRLEARGIKPGFVKENGVKNESDFRKLIQANLDNLEMYEEPQTYFKADGPDLETVKAITSLFR